MDLHDLAPADLHHMLADEGAHWTTVDLDDDDLADLIDSLSPTEREEFGFDQPCRNPYPDAWWQTTDEQAEHLIQPYFGSSFAKVRWFALRGLADQATLTDDPAELSRIKHERRYWLDRTEADQVLGHVTNFR